MMPRLLLLTPAVALLISCTRDAPAAPAPAPVAAAPASESAVEQLDRIDLRSPVPLLPAMADHQKQNMRDHLVAVQEIVAALADDDFAGVARAAGRIGFSEQMGQMCTHMGAGAPGFTEMALGFHHAADRVADAAREQDRAQVLTQLSATLNTCTTCHAAYKQQVVDEPTWHALTSRAHAASH